MLTEGYWQVNYWAEDYWNDLYWQDYGVLVITGFVRWFFGPWFRRS